MAVETPTPEPMDHQRLAELRAVIWDKVERARDEQEHAEATGVSLSPAHGRAWRMVEELLLAHDHWEKTARSFDNGQALAIVTETAAVAVAAGARADRWEAEARKAQATLARLDGGAAAR